MTYVNGIGTQVARHPMREPFPADLLHTLGGRAMGVGLLLACLLAIGWVPQALAVNRYGVICLMNETQVTIPYLYKVGSQGSWERRELEPGQTRWFSHQYDKPNENHSPSFSIRFDSDLRSAQKFNITYTLERHAALGQECAYGKKYAFRYDGGNRRYVDLKAVR
jgi:hypothetical protein